MKEDNMFEESFTFDDILIKPSHTSWVTSRAKVDISTNVGGVELELPIISSSMSLFDTVSPYNPEPYTRFAIALAEAGGMHIFSRALSFEDRISAVNTVKECGLNVGMAVGIGEFNEFQEILENLNVVVSIDIANGAIISPVTWRGKKPLIVGNFANPEISLTDRFQGNIIIKLGVGNGSACSTRIATGVGYPQAGLVYEASRNSNYPLISDGGVSSVADFTKAIGLGADIVMTGRMLGHTQETPWDTIIVKDVEYKPYRGMASQEEKRSKKFVEGASGYIPYTDKTIQEVIYDLSDGLRSAMSYCDSFDLKEFRSKVRFVKSPSHVHESSVRLTTL
jgi:IMP dehydrogenase/GMP reductase